MGDIHFALMLVLLALIIFSQVRTDLAEGMHARGEINISDIRLINLQDDPGFPFPYSTKLAAPEWPVSALRHVSQVRIF
jgi:hypothetical protein